MSRAHNFSAGPAVLPLPVIEQLRDALPEFGDTRLGLMELSHRSQAFSEVVTSIQDSIRSLLNIPEDYTVLLQQGGASLQFYALALNLLRPGEAAEYIDTGTWSTKAIKEARRVSDHIQVSWTGKEQIYRELPLGRAFPSSTSPVFLHYTSNNTIFGTQWPVAPNHGSALLVSDMSSDICSRPLDVSDHDVIYAGAQKNLGPSGVTVVILSPRAMERSAAAQNLPSMLDWTLQADKGSLFNTPNTFGLYALNRVLSWLKEQGGLNAMATRNREKAAMLYDELDGRDFWRPHAHTAARSLMNVTWRAPSEALEAQFISEADKAGLKGLKGHRSVGGIRASIYNACPVQSVCDLVAFMREFADRNQG